MAPLLFITARTSNWRYPRAVLSLEHGLTTVFVIVYAVQSAPPLTPGRQGRAVPPAPPSLPHPSNEVK